MSDFWKDENGAGASPEQENPQNAPAQEMPAEETVSEPAAPEEPASPEPGPSMELDPAFTTAPEPASVEPIEPAVEPVEVVPERQAAPEIPAPEPVQAAPEQPAAPYPPYPGQWNAPSGETPPIPPQYPQMQGAYPGYPQYPQAQPVQPAQPQPYPAYLQPAAPAAYPVQQGYPQGMPNAYPAYPAYPAPYGQQAPAKKKMSTGLKVFLWIAGLLAAAGIIGMVLYFAIQAGNSPSSDRYPFFGYDMPFDGYDDYDKYFDKYFGGGNDEDDGNDPEDEEALPPEEPDEEEELPDVDVTPNTDGITIHQKPGGSTQDAEAVYKRVSVSTVMVSATLTQDGKDATSTGTGIIATSDGYIITNSHVVLNSKSTRVTVTTYDGMEYDAVVVGTDRTTDLAVLKTNDYGFTPAEFGDAGELSMGEWVLAIGNPGGARFSSSLTRGIISGLDREVGKYSEEGMTYIQTDAAINPGNSGGPLVNMYGQVVGINSSKIITEGYEGMGFAIPVSRAQPIINELLSGGYIKGRTRLGIMCRELDSDFAEIYSVPKGLQITEIQPDSSFVDTEAQPGDIIIAIEGETVERLQDVSNLLLRYAPGDEITVTLYRPAETFGGKGTEIDVEITLLEDKGETQN